MEGGVHCGKDTNYLRCESQSVLQPPAIIYALNENANTASRLLCDEGCRFDCNVGAYLPDYMASYPIIRIFIFVAVNTSTLTYSKHSVLLCSLLFCSSSNLWIIFTNLHPIQRLISELKCTDVLF